MHCTFPMGEKPTVEKGKTMAETNQRNTKKLIAIIVAAVLVVALIVVGVVFALKKNNSAEGPFADNGEPLYPATSSVTEVEYLHRGGVNMTTGVDMDEKELTDKKDIQTFMDELRAVTLKEATDEDRAAVDFNGDVDMFTISSKDGTDVYVLIMGSTLSVGSNFYVTEGLDLEELTKNFGAMDYSDKLVSADEDTDSSDAGELATAAQ